MKSILRSLYNGKIIPWERRETQNEVCLGLVRKIEDAEQHFIQTLPPGDKERFQSLLTLQAELSAVQEENNFAYGFAFGLLLMTDVMNEAESMRNA